MEANAQEKKHIALVLPAMRMGGAEKICLNFLDYLTKQYKVTMILSKIEGDLLEFVPNSVEIVEDRLWSFDEILKYDIKGFKLWNLILDFLYYFKIKIGKNSEKNYRYLVLRTPKRKEHYDCAISYVANVSTQIFNVLDRIDADKKIGWMHGETTEIKDTKLFSKCYKRFDKIFAVSNVTKEHFVTRFPECKDIADVYYNPIRVDEIKRKSEEKIKYKFSDSATNIVSVGRLTSEKGMTMIPRIVELLTDYGLDVHWCIVGDGTNFKLIKNEIEKKKLSDRISMVGNQINPYPYIKNCDIYVQPSFEEGYSTTICEAGILGKAIVGTTTSGGIREQIVEGESGLLAEPTPESLAEQIKRLIIDENLKKILETNILKIDYSNAKEFDKLRRFI